MRLYIVPKSQLVKVPSHALARLIRAPGELEEELRTELSIGVHQGQLPWVYKESGAESAIEDGRGTVTEVYQHIRHLTVWQCYFPRKIPIEDTSIWNLKTICGALSSLDRQGRIFPWDCCLICDENWRTFVSMSIAITARASVLTFVVSDKRNFPWNP
jgi:hypothetical protein